MDFKRKNSNDYCEKRSYMRMQTEIPATLKINHLQSAKCICKNLTAKGMLVECDTPIAEGKQVSINIPATSGNYSSLKALLQVLRCEKQKEGRFLLGTEILRIIN